MKQLATGMQYFPDTLSDDGQYWTYYKGYSVSIYKGDDGIWVGEYNNNCVFGYSKVSVIEKVRNNINRYN